MIKFLRRIRKNLLAAGKTGKPALPVGRYLKYAVGEILLVVIGILIALQVNNWNEAKNDRSFETKMLLEIEKSLKVDQLNLQEHINAYTDLNYAVDHFTNLTQNGTIFQDTMAQDLWKLNIGRYFQFNQGPYNALKSSGIDRISDDSLRNHLINFFDFELSVFQTQIDHSTRRYRSNVELLLSFREKPFLNKNSKWIVNRIPKDIFQKPDFIWLLADIEWRANNSKDKIEAFIPKIDELIQHINHEIRQ